MHPEQEHLCLQLKVSVLFLNSVVFSVLTVHKLCCSCPYCTYAVFLPCCDKSDAVDWTNVCGEHVVQHKGSLVVLEVLSLTVHE